MLSWALPICGQQQRRPSRRGGYDETAGVGQREDVQDAPQKTLLLTSFLTTEPDTQCHVVANSAHGGCTRPLPRALNLERDDEEGYTPCRVGIAMTRWQEGACLPHRVFASSTRRGWVYLSSCCCHCDAARIALPVVSSFHFDTARVSPFPSCRCSHYEVVMGDTSPTFSCTFDATRVISSSL